MKKLRISIILSLLAICLMSKAQIRVMSLNSVDGEVEWSVAPQDQSSATGKTISEPGYTFADGVMRLLPDGTRRIVSSRDIQGIAPGQFGVVYDKTRTICVGSGEIGV